MKILPRLYFGLGALALALVGFASTATGAVASSVSCAALSPSCTSFNAPLRGGLDLDASNWGINPFTGTSYNDLISVYQENLAGRASDFTLVTVAATAVPASATAAAKGQNANPGAFLIEYTPRGVPSKYCVSTISDTNGVYARLRPCALASTMAAALPSAFNQWQSFWEVPQGDGFFQFGAFGEPSAKYLNVKGFGGNGTPVVSWSDTGTAANQIWEPNECPTVCP